MVSVRKRGKFWQWRFTYYDNEGVRRERSKSGYSTKGEALVAGNKAWSEWNSGVNIEKGEMLFTKYYKEWIELYKLGAYSEDNDASYRHALNLAERHLGGLKLKEVTHERYQGFLNEYSKGRARETVRKAHNKIGASLRFAFNSGHIAINPTYQVVIRGKDGTLEESKYLHEHEAQKLLDALLKGLQLNYVSRHMLILQLATGARISEIAGLQFSDLNFLNNRIDINKAWGYQRKNDFVPTKSKEARNISVDKETMQIIKAFYDHQLSKKVVDSKKRLFARKGKVPSIKSVNDTLASACKRAGIKRVTSHAMRHTHASLLILNEVSIAYISKRLGHRSIDITTNVYSHVLEELEIKSEKESADFMMKFYD